MYFFHNYFVLIILVNKSLTQCPNTHIIENTNTTGQTKPPIDAKIISGSLTSISLI